ncbi:MAG: helix-turn-helix transcriptional regulator, partial [Chitinophagaceae bacterium]|nr:helix-turn-helix transcriptional regulator [Chitinophagaceae bacterium]
TIGEIVNEILTNSSAANLQTFFFENKVRELLLQILLESEKTVPAELSPVSVNALIKAKAIILSDISRHHTIGEISKRVQLNEFDLKTGFKKLWGVGIYEMLLDARMHKAKKLLLETSKPMKEIASLTGYDRLTSFIRSFRNYHNITPGSLRR